MEETNDGNLFTADISTLDMLGGAFLTKLTPEEEKGRHDWAKTRRGLTRRYHQKHRALDRALGDLSPTEMLRLPVAPPLLKYRNITARTAPSEGRNRVFLGAIGSWDDFPIGVRDFTVPVPVDATKVGKDVLYHSQHDDNWVTYEFEEMGFIKNHVLQPLQRAGLLKHRTRDDVLGPCKKSAPVQDTPDAPALGFADHFLKAGSTIVPIEFKATHNLPVPNQPATVVIGRCNQRSARTLRGRNIAHTVGQLVYYMFSGKSRYGVLCSGTRSYFFKVEEAGTDGDVKVLITDAWFTGQPDFLRAWAYLFGLANGDNGSFRPPPRWWEKWETHPNQLGEDAHGADEIPSVATNRYSDQLDDDADEADDFADDRTDDKIDQRPQKRQRRDNQDPRAGGWPTTHLMTWLDPGLAPSIPHVDGEEIRMLRLLANGNNDVYLARWRGEEVAVKAFDYYKGWGWFKNEIRAYEHLKDAWGMLVPVPYFIADWRGLLVLGMQLGRAPISWDRNFANELDNLFRALRCDYGFDHLDGEGENTIYIPDKSGTGQGRLVAIDLELHKILR